MNSSMNSVLLAVLAVLSIVGVDVSAFAPLNVPSTTAARAPFSLSSTVDDKTEVREYFNTEGFNRWNKIYSESDDVNSVQLDIRTGHDQTIQKILNWISDDGDIAGKSVCDCGCGVGSLAIPLAQMGTLFFIFCGLLDIFSWWLWSKPFLSCSSVRWANTARAYCPSFPQY